jgi:hypothetical protein
MREALLRTLKGVAERYQYGHVLSQGLSPEQFSQAFNLLFWTEFRSAWDALVRSGSCEAFGVQFAWLDGELHRV